MPSDRPGERFTRACAYRMPFGQHKGKTLSFIGANEAGLLYLDWLVGQKWVDGDLKEALQDYLGHEAIRRQLDSYLGD